MNESQVSRVPRPTLEAYVIFASKSDHANKAVTEITGNQVKTSFFGRLMHSWFESSRERIVENFKTALREKYPSFTLTELSRGPLTGAVIKQVVDKAEAMKNILPLQLVAKSKVEVVGCIAEKNPNNADLQRALTEAQEAADKITAIIAEITSDRFDVSKLDDFVREAEAWTTVASSKAAASIHEDDAIEGDEESLVIDFKAAGEYAFEQPNNNTGEDSLLISDELSLSSEESMIPIDEPDDFSKSIESINNSLNEVGSTIAGIQSRTEGRKVNDVGQQKVQALVSLAEVELADDTPITTLNAEDLNVIQDVSNEIILAEGKLTQVQRKLDEQLIDEKKRKLLSGLNASKSDIPDNNALKDKLVNIESDISGDLQKMKLLKRDASLSIKGKQARLTALSSSIEEKIKDSEQLKNPSIQERGGEDWEVIEGDSELRAQPEQAAQEQKIQDTCSSCSFILDQFYKRYHEAVQLQQYTENNAFLAARVATLAPFSSKQKVPISAEKKKSLTAAEISGGFNKHLGHATRLVEQKKQAIHDLKQLIDKAKSMEELSQVVIRGEAFLKKESILPNRIHSIINELQGYLKPLYQAANKAERELEKIKKSLRPEAITDSFAVSSRVSIDSEKSFKETLTAGGVFSLGLLLRNNAAVINGFSKNSLPKDQIEQLGGRIKQEGLNAMVKEETSSEASVDIQATPDLSSISKDDLKSLGKLLTEHAVDLSQLSIDSKNDDGKESTLYHNQAFYGAMGKFFIEQTESKK